MASHIDMEVGRYGAAVAANQAGVAADLVYCRLRGHATFYHGYLVHKWAQTRATFFKACLFFLFSRAGIY
jgi:hypothetical protein